MLVDGETKAEVLADWADCLAAKNGSLDGKLRSWLIRPEDFPETLEGARAERHCLLQPEPVQGGRGHLGKGSGGSEAGV